MSKVLRRGGLCIILSLVFLFFSCEGERARALLEYQQEETETTIRLTVGQDDYVLTLALSPWAGEELYRSGTVTVAEPAVIAGVQFTFADGQMTMRSGGNEITTPPAPASTVPMLVHAFSLRREDVTRTETEDGTDGRMTAVYFSDSLGDFVLYLDDDGLPKRVRFSVPAGEVDGRIQEWKTSQS